MSLPTRTFFFVAGASLLAASAFCAILAFLFLVGLVSALKYGHWVAALACAGLAAMFGMIAWGAPVSGWWAVREAVKKGRGKR